MSEKPKSKKTIGRKERTDIFGAVVADKEGNTVVKNQSLVDKFPEYLKRSLREFKGILSDTQLIIAESYLANNLDKTKTYQELGVDNAMVYRNVNLPEIKKYIVLRQTKGNNDNVISVDGILKELNSLYYQSDPNDIDTRREILKDIANHRKVFKDGIDEFTMSLQSMSLPELRELGRNTMKEIDEMVKMQVSWSTPVESANAKMD